MSFLYVIAAFIHFFSDTSIDAWAIFPYFKGLAFYFQGEENGWLDIVQDWQTLIAGLIAFVPGTFAAVFVWKQVNEQRSQFFQAEEAASVKARLKLSRNLSHISSHLDDCYDRLISKEFSYSSHVLPETLLEDILDAGVTSRGKNFSFFQNYIEKIQTYASLCQAYSDFGGEENLAKCFRLLGEIDGLTDLLYPFSRFEVEKLPNQNIDEAEIGMRLRHNLRRGKSISGSNLEKLLNLGHFKI